MTPRALRILYIEDDEADIDFAQMSLERLGYTNLKLHVASDGETALNFLGLGNSTPHAQVAPPHLILLDLNIPRIHGKDLLKLIKQSDRLKRIPVVVLSTSEYQRDVDELYSLGASGYFKKPASYLQYTDIFKTIYDYWAIRAELPSAKAGV